MAGLEKDTGPGSGDPGSAGGAKGAKCAKSATGSTNAGGATNAKSARGGAAASPRGTAFVLLSLALVLAGILAFSLCVGAVSLPLRRVVGALFLPASAGPESIIVSLRFARGLLAILVGAVLGASGAAFQGLFRNPLADPYVIGGSSGSALGAVLATVLGFNVTIAGFSGVGVGAFAGGILSVSIVYAVARASRVRKDATGLLLAGTALSSMLSALVSVVITLHDRDLHQIFFWLLGGFSAKGMDDFLSALPPVMIGLTGLFLSSRVLDVLASGDEEALSFGLDPSRARLAVGLFATLAVSAAVAASGTIGFVGLISPHMARRMTGPTHRRLLPASALVGAILLVSSDVAARTLFAPVEVPVGALTALLGAPFFLWKIARSERELSR